LPQHSQPTTNWISGALLTGFKGKRTCHLPLFRLIYSSTLQARQAGIAQAIPDNEAQQEGTGEENERIAGVAFCPLREDRIQAQRDRLSYITSVSVLSLTITIRVNRSLVWRESRPSTAASRRWYATGSRRATGATAPTRQKSQ
jgi:hypothetical protein